MSPCEEGRRIKRERMDRIRKEGEKNNANINANINAGKKKPILANINGKEANINVKPILMRRKPILMRGFAAVLEVLLALLCAMQRDSTQLTLPLQGTTK